MSIFVEVQKAVAEQLGVEESAVTMEAKLVDDLKADSLDVVQLVMNLEQEYDLEISDDDLGKFSTISDIVGYIEASKK